MVNNKVAMLRMLLDTSLKECYESGESGSINSLEQWKLQEYLLSKVAWNYHFNTFASQVKSKILAMCCF